MAARLDRGATSPHKQRFRVIGDVHLLLLKDEQILLGQRINTGYGDGAYHPPSGHLEEGESVIEALIRETKEEIGVTIYPDDISFAHVMHNASGGGRVAFFFTVSRWEGDPINIEPDKCAKLRWFPLHELPEHMIGYARAALQGYVAGEAFSTYGY